MELLWSLFYSAPSTSRSSAVEECEQQKSYLLALEKTRSQIAQARSVVARLRELQAFYDTVPDAAPHAGRSSSLDDSAPASLANTPLPPPRVLPTASSPRAFPAPQARGSVVGAPKSSSLRTIHPTDCPVSPTDGNAYFDPHTGSWQSKEGVDVDMAAFGDIPDLGPDTATFEDLHEFDITPALLESLEKSECEHTRLQPLWGAQPVALRQSNEQCFVIREMGIQKLISVSKKMSTATSKPPPSVSTTAPFPTASSHTVKSSSNAFSVVQLPGAVTNLGVARGAAASPGPQVTADSDDDDFGDDFDQKLSAPPLAAAPTREFPAQIDDVGDVGRQAVEEEEDDWDAHAPQPDNPLLLLQAFRENDDDDNMSAFDDL
mmetsp:Transcript_20790/g.52630  ORF Transcript_20790/g.52630 Transcript_20790/m.52630 type:complete len:376 (+) Transcript_20790:247-1374(+)